jgi:hypothetical protein
LLPTAKFGELESHELSTEVLPKVAIDS